MKKQTAGFLFLGVCIVLAALLLFRVITPIVSGFIFAVALIILGGFSKGFRK